MDNIINILKNGKNTDDILKFSTNLCIQRNSGICGIYGIEKLQKIIKDIYYFNFFTNILGLNPEEVCISYYLAPNKKNVLVQWHNA